ncbi:MAG: hypothetical protein WCY93_07780 [Anaerolineaceae bacterium]
MTEIFRGPGDYWIKVGMKWERGRIDEFKGYYFVCLEGKEPFLLTSFDQISTVTSNPLKNIRYELGLYKIEWISGGSSLAIFTQDDAGNTMFTCTNWVNTTLAKLADHYDDIKFIEPIATHQMEVSESLLHVINERHRQREKYDSEHDAYHKRGELVAAAVNLAQGHGHFNKYVWSGECVPVMGEASNQDLVQAAALLVAELERRGREEGRN